MVRWVSLRLTGQIFNDLLTVLSRWANHDVIERESVFQLKCFIG